MSKTNSYFFYDLETTGVDSRKSRIMQFAGQRTDLDLNPIGDPYDILIKITDDVLPNPDAILLTGITPQKTLEEGITEAEFCKLFMEEIVTPGTCFLGYNSIRFDDEFMRFLLYRNFYDPYAWQWKNDCSRWDLLDVVRMTRALRPKGITWPFDANGVCTNRLELLTQANDLLHEAAHDALSDVKATIAVANMIRTKQRKIYDYLFSVRNKKDVSALVLKGQPLVYSSGRYPSEYEKTSVVVSLGMHPTSQAALVYDLRHDPTPFLTMNVEELVDAWRYTKDKDAVRLPIKAMQFNHAPAVAPLGVLDEGAMERIKVTLDLIKKHLAILKSDPAFYDRVSKAADVMNIERDKKIALHFKASPNRSVDEQLYDGFIPDSDRLQANKLVSSEPSSISGFTDTFKDERLKTLVPLYKARNYSKFLSDDERVIWEDHREQMLVGGGAASPLAKFGARLQELNQTVTDEHKQYLLEELRLYAESIVPES